MTDNEDAFEIRRKAFEILKKREIFESLNWLFAQSRIGLSEHLKVISEKTN